MKNQHQQDGSGLQDSFLNDLRKQRVEVAVYLVNGIKLVGHIGSFDRFVIQLKAGVTQIIYKHAISTIVPNNHSLRHRNPD